MNKQYEIDLSDDIKVCREYKITICNDCINLKGKMCNNPCCVFIRRTMDEVKEYLDMLLIAPVIDGKREILDKGRKITIREARG